MTRRPVPPEVVAAMEELAAIMAAHEESARIAAAQAADYLNMIREAERVLRAARNHP